MTIETHTTDRKALARQIAELLHEAVTYAGVPSCAYKIGPVTIDRGGAIHTDDLEAFKTLKPFLIEQEYIDSEPDDEPEGTSKEEPAPATGTELRRDTDPEPDIVHPSALDIERMEISMPAEDMTATSLKNLIYMLYSKQYLINRATGTDVLTISDGVVSRLEESMPDTLGTFSELLMDFQALGELDGFDFRDGNVTLAFPFDAEQPDRWTAYGFLFNHIVKAALSAERVFPKRQRPENEKYYMRSWLIRLGLGGVEFKTLRNLMLRNLKGNTAFPNDAAALKHKEKYAEIRRASREGQVEAE